MICVYEENNGEAYQFRGHPFVFVCILNALVYRFEHNVYTYLEKPCAITNHNSAGREADA